MRIDVLAGRGKTRVNVPLTRGRLSKKGRSACSSPTATRVLPPDSRLRTAAAGRVRRRSTAEPTRDTAGRTPSTLAIIRRVARLPIAIAAAALLLAVPLAHAREAAVKVTLTAAGHTPKIGVRWHYAVRATTGGRPVAGRITAQIVDPIGGTHPVDFGTTKKPTLNMPFKGVFRDFVLWPGDS